MLLLNDQHNPNWRVTVNGESAELLLCNYVMRGVRVEPGEHEVVFEFRPPRKGFYVSMLAALLGVGMLGYLGFVEPRARGESPSEGNGKAKSEPGPPDEATSAKTERSEPSKPRSTQPKGRSKSKKRRR